MEKKLEHIIDICQIRDRTEPFCRYSFYLEMNKIHCPYYLKNENTILSGCNYYKMNKFLGEEVGKR